VHTTINSQNRHTVKCVAAMTHKALWQTSPLKTIVSYVDYSVAHCLILHLHLCLPSFVLTGFNLQCLQSCLMQGMPVLQVLQV
jgi:hypothetical protein